MRLAGKVAVITGGANGIGRASSRIFAREGATVLIADIDEDAGARLEAELQGGGAQARFHRLDVTDAVAIEAAMAGAIQQFGRLDILYNNAGGSSRDDGPVAAIEADAFMRTIQLNLVSTFLTAKYAIPHMAAGGGGSIINTVSSVARVALPGLSAYTAAKGAIDALTRAMAVDYAAQGIRVNAVMPALTKSERVAKSIGQDGPMQSWTGRHLFGLLDPEQIAQTALFLASDESSGLTGETITIDSGATIAGMTPAT